MEYAGCRCHSDDHAGKTVNVKEKGIILQKPMYTARGLEDIPGILAWLSTRPDDLDLCIGGSRASECPEAYQMTVEILSDVLEELS